jgi:hypothetical protein
VGGPLTAEGAAEVARQMNDNREVLQQVRVILETADRELLCEFVAMLYRRVVVSD